MSDDSRRVDRPQLGLVEPSRTPTECERLHDYVEAMSPRSGNARVKPSLRLVEGDDAA